MSYSTNNKNALGGIDFSKKTKEEVQYLFRDILEEGMHGLCISPYEEGQQPGDILSKSQVERRMKILAPYMKWVRSFSCLEGNEYIPKVAKKLGIKTLVGAWLGVDKEKNEKEIKSLVKLAKEDFVDIAAVGNEVMYRNDLSQEELLDYIYRVKEELPEIKVGYVDAYYEFAMKPQLTAACDIILANCYPYWEGYPADHALAYLKLMYHQAKIAAKGKKVIITETGWPTHGKIFKNAIPSIEHAMKYFIQAQLWTQDEEIDLFYFSSFDESWKIGSEGDVGAHWGLWSKDEQLKY